MLLQLLNEWKDGFGEIEDLPTFKTQKCRFILNKMQDNMRITKCDRVQAHFAIYGRGAEIAERYHAHRANWKENGQQVAKLLNQLDDSCIASHDLTADQYSVLNEIRYCTHRPVKNAIFDAVKEAKHKFMQEAWSFVFLTKLVKHEHDISDPDCILILRFHMLHLSEVDPTQVAYYPTLKHIVEGREVRTKLGKYLAKYKTLYNLNDEKIQYMVGKFGAERMAEANTKIRYVESDDPDGWCQGYDNGPHSCMQGKRNVRSYARSGNGLRLALLENGDGDIIARTIVRDDETKGYVRIYPTDGGKADLLLKSLLSADGYKDEVDLNRIEINAIYDDGRYLTPYLDGYADEADLSSCETYFTITPSGEYSLDDTDGVAVEGRETCVVCEDSMSEDESNYVESEDGCVCDYCINRSFTYVKTGRYDGEYVRDHDAVYCESDNANYSTSYAEELGISRCAISRKYYSQDDLYYDVANCEYIHEDYAVRLDIWEGENVSDDGVFTCKDNVTTLSNGKVVHDDEAEELQAEIDMQLTLEFEPQLEAA